MVELIPEDYIGTMLESWRYANGVGERECTNETDSDTSCTDMYPYSSACWSTDLGDGYVGRCMYACDTCANDQTYATSSPPPVAADTLASSSPTLVTSS